MIVWHIPGSVFRASNVTPETEENVMVTRYCPCGQPILVRFVKLETWRTFFLAWVDGSCHGLTSCPTCGATLDVDVLK